MRVRLTEAEQRAFTAKASALHERPSRVHRRLVREFLLGEPDYFGNEVEALRILCDELARVGNNLNQLVRLAHRGDWPNGAELAHETEAVLSAVRSAQAAVGSGVRRVRERRV